MNKKVSIVIPIYNAEKFINRAIKSVLNQTYKNIEILLMDDGSKDKSLKIINKYAQKYPDVIHVYSHENHGVGYTRNRALNLLSGEYICFLDADDYLDKDYIETLINNIKNNDIIVSGFKQVNQDGKLLFNQKLNRSFWGPFKQLACTGKLYKTSFLLKNNIQFNDLKIAEDVVFSVTSYSKSSKVISIEYTGYNYVYNETSATHTMQLKKDNDILNLLNILTSIITDDLFNNNKKYLSYFYLKLFVCFFFDKAKILDLTDLQQYYFGGLDWLKKYYRQEHLKFGLIFNRFETLKINMAVNISLFAYKCHLGNWFIKIVHKHYCEAE